MVTFWNKDLVAYMNNMHITQLGFCVAQWLVLYACPEFESHPVPNPTLFQERAVFSKMKMDPAKWAQTQNAGEVSSLQRFFSNPLNWWRVRFGLICCWRNTFTTDTYVHASSTPPPPHLPNIKETVLCLQGDSTAHHQITKLHLWPLDHSSSDVKCERERLNITIE